MGSGNNAAAGQAVVELANGLADVDAGNLELGGGWAGSPIELQGQDGTQAGWLGPVIHS